MQSLGSHRSKTLDQEERKIKNGKTKKQYIYK